MTKRRILLLFLTAAMLLVVSASLIQTNVLCFSGCCFYTEASCSCSGTVGSAGECSNTSSCDAADGNCKCDDEKTCYCSAFPFVE